LLLAIHPPKLDIYAVLANDLMMNKHLPFKRYFLYRNGFIVRCTMSHFCTLQIMLSDPNVMRCPPHGTLCFDFEFDFFIFPIFSFTDHHSREK